MSTEDFRRLLFVATVLLAACNSSGLNGQPPESPDLALSFANEDLTMPEDLATDPCSDGLRDGDETDVDCGGLACGPCTDGKGCLRSADCVHQNCTQATCEPAKPCMNGVRDGQESDVDCGGPACLYCGLGRRCVVDADCQSGLCNRRSCVAPAPLTLGFQPPVLYPAGLMPRAIAIADFNRDGHIDVVVQNQLSDDVTVFLGRGDGTLSGGTSFPVGHYGLAVLTADFNNDGKMDIAVTGPNTMGVATLLGKGDGTFGAQTLTMVLGADLADWGFAAADLNGDHFPDLVLGNHGQLPILLGKGKGDFSVAFVPPSNEPDHVQLEDFDGDGLLDVVTDDQNGIAFFKGDGKGGLHPFVRYPGSFGCPSAVAYDLDRDGKLDIANRCGDVFVGNGDGTFAAARTNTSAPSPSAVAVADFDRDGFPDLAVADFGGMLYVLHGAKGGQFPNKMAFAGGTRLMDVTVADLDEDGKPDALLVDDTQSQSQLVVLINASQ